MVTFQSAPSFASATVCVPDVISRLSILSRSSFRTVLSRRSNADLFRLLSWKAAIRNTFFSSFFFANKSAPVGVFSPMNK